MITLRNDFHGTEARVKAEIGETLTPSQTRRVQRKLCPFSDCRCGVVRGRQYDETGRRFAVTEVREYGDDYVYMLELDQPERGRPWSVAP